MKHQRNLLLAIALLCLLLLGAGLLTGCRLPWESAPSKPGQPNEFGEPSEPGVYCPIDGEPTTSQAINRRPLAVMIENSPQARPQSGLRQACVVYEAITEGGITRFLAIYLHNNPKVIGPVRSARPHFINLAREYQAAYVHCGESYEALQILASDPTIFNLDQMKYGKPFWRDHSRKAPHNLYASSEKLRAEMAKLHWEGAVSNLPSFTSNRVLNSGTAAARVNIKFPGAVRYKLQLVYDAKRGGYLRYMDGKLHVDRETHQPIVAKNVLIERVVATPFAESTHGTFDVEVVGNGDGLFLSNGQQENMHWVKNNDASPTIYADQGNGALPFSPGQTWVEIVPTNGSVTVMN